MQKGDVIEALKWKFVKADAIEGASDTLLIVSMLNEIFVSDGVAQEVNADQIAVASIPIAIISVVVGALYALWYDAKLKKKYGRKT